MSRKICFISLLAALTIWFGAPSLILRADPLAQDQPTWFQNLLRRVSVQRQTPPNILRGLSFNSGGGLDSAWSECFFSGNLGERTGMWASNTMGGNELSPGTSTALPNFAHIFGSPNEPFTRLSLWYFPVICSSYPLGDAYAISPSGHRFSPYVRTEDYAYAVRLPLEAYAQPGWWRLVAESSSHFEISLLVPSPDRPFYIADRLSDLESPRYHARYLIGGFAPHERVAGFLMTNPSDGYQEYRGHFEIGVRADGYAIFEIDSPDLVVILGQNGASVAMSHSNDWHLITSQYGNQSADQIDLTRILFEAYWGSGGLGDPINYNTIFDSGNEALCTNTPPSRLYGWTHARVTPGDPNRLRAEPESDAVLGQIPGGAAFTILGGPVCGRGTHLRWWYVDYNGMQGWTAEGRGDTYWLEP
ncbi:MAG: SH3 domain-containing protein [Anaerolineae bacterium]|nr:SH3 domain-containing protein [Anaerolineae bacterium]